MLWATFPNFSKHLIDSDFEDLIPGESRIQSTMTYNV